MTRSTVPGDRDEGTSDTGASGEPVGKTPSSTSQAGRKVDGRNLAVRTATGLVLAVVTFGAIWAGAVPFAVVATVLCLVGICEFCGLARGMGMSPSQPTALIGGAAIMAVSTLAPASWRGHGLAEWHGLVLALAVVAAMMVTLLARSPGSRGDRSRGLDAVVTLFGFLYVAWLFCFAILLRRLPGTVEMAGGVVMDAGALWVILFVVTTATSDIGCYAFGKMWGRTPLAPLVSPNKTIEGSVGGLLVSTLFALLLAGMVRSLHVPATGGAVAYVSTLSLPLVGLYGVVVAAIGQMGDLWESLLKREAGVKDSGHVIVGHGGVLDRFDSYFFSAPVAYCITVVLLA